MNQKTAKLLRKSASVFAFNQFQETQELPDQRRIYKNLKAKWAGMNHRERGAYRAQLRAMVKLAFAQPTNTVDSGEVDGS